MTSEVGADEEETSQNWETGYRSINQTRKKSCTPHTFLMWDVGCGSGPLSSGDTEPIPKL